MKGIFQVNTIELNKKDYLSNWPFKAENVTIIKGGFKGVSFAYLFVQIKKRKYALNGIAESKFKRKNIVDSRFFIKGKSVSEFIKIGLNL